MMINSFYNNRLIEVNKISSIDSKFDMTERCYKDFINLMGVDAESENIYHKFVVMNEVSERYDKLIREYKKFYESL